MKDEYHRLILKIKSYRNTLHSSKLISIHFSTFYMQQTISKNIFELKTSILTKKPKTKIHFNEINSVSSARFFPLLSISFVFFFCLFSTSSFYFLAQVTFALCSTYPFSQNLRPFQ